MNYLKIGTDDLLVKCTSSPHKIGVVGEGWGSNPFGCVWVFT